ncbi:MAG: 3-isopropylmalate dehydratase large subunit [Proteobacteria bacterium]|nr:MAG: 3-isopropylmalate dehydratase large subunit [Pseudomonadota bacterium]
MSDGARTLFDKVWDAHVVTQEPDSPAVLYIDLHLVHEVTSPQAFAMLRERGLGVRRPELTLATMDHITPTTSLSLSDVSDPVARQTLDQLVANCEAHGVELHRLGTPGQGIVHVIGPELGATQPGKTIVCGDSHTSTHGAFGAIAFGVGTSQVGQVLATQCLLQRPLETMEVRFEGLPAPGVGPKDMVLALIAEIGVDGGTGCAIEYRGEAIEAMDMDGRMTICNMSIEAGARVGMVAPDETTFAYLKGRPHAPAEGPEWDAAVARWRALRTDEGAAFDHSVTIDVSRVRPMVTWGTNPAMAGPIDGALPTEGDEALAALRYRGLEPGGVMAGHPIDVVFVGSCTNSRMRDLRDAAEVLRGRRVKDGVRMLVVPGSWKIKQAAEAEGLDAVFAAAGAEWRQPGCSMCIAMNGDMLAPGQRAISTSNRNFVGRQGKGSHTFLASPATAAASAVMGAVADPRALPPVAEVIQ